MTRIGRLLAAGSAGNAQLTAMLGALLLALLAVEGATLLDIRALLNVHAFVGMLLIPVVGLKLASAAWRMLRYYVGHAEYVRRGPPHVFLRTLVAPLVVLSTLTLFGSGVALLALGKTEGSFVLLHQASFFVWLGSTSAHVLAHLPKLPRLLRARMSGLPARIALVGGTLACGLLLAAATLPRADGLQDRVTAHAGFDDR